MRRHTVESTGGRQRNQPKLADVVHINIQDFLGHTADGVHNLGPTKTSRWLRSSQISSPGAWWTEAGQFAHAGCEPSSVTRTTRTSLQPNRLQPGSTTRPSAQEPGIVTAAELKGRAAARLAEAWLGAHQCVCGRPWLCVCPSAV